MGIPNHVYSFARIGFQVKRFQLFDSGPVEIETVLTRARLVGQLVAPEVNVQPSQTATYQHVQCCSRRPSLVQQRLSPIQAATNSGH